MELRRFARVLPPLLLGVSLGWLSAPLAADERTTLSVTRVRTLGPDGMRVFLSVVDAQERPVTGLDAANFSVRVDARPVTGWELDTGGAGPGTALCSRPGARSRRRRHEGRRRSAAGRRALRLLQAAPAAIGSRS